jgi:SAM-dependent methyltransferase
VYDAWVLFIEILIFIFQAALICALLIFIYQFVARALSSFTDVPFVPTDYAFLPPIADALDIGQHDVVYDLGCGDGRLLFYCAKHYPEARFVGVERNPVLILYARIKKFLFRAKNVEIRRENIFDTDLTDATRIYVFLLPEVMNDIAPKLHAPRIVSRAFEIPGRTPEREFILREEPPGPWNTFTVYVY